jgi:isopenicillin N synthase-like dioxygenase
MKSDVPPSLFAPLKTIRLQDLRRGSTEEKNKIFAAAKEDGIFYLDFTEDLGEYKLGDLVENIYSFSHSLFDLDLAEKMQYDVDKISELKLNGHVSDFYQTHYPLLINSSYKPIRRNVGGIKGQRDGFESYAVWSLLPLSKHKTNDLDPSQRNSGLQ